MASLFGVIIAEIGMPTVVVLRPLILKMATDQHIAETSHHPISAMATIFQFAVH